MDATIVERASSDGPSCYTNFLLEIHLKSGRNLAIRDGLGSSDPYVKLKHGGKFLYKTNTIIKNLNPIWDKKLKHLISDLSTPLEVEVFDYDRFTKDDFMGRGTIDLSQLRFGEPTDLKLELEDETSDQNLGYLNLQLTIHPQTREERQQFLRSQTRYGSEKVERKRTIQQTWTSVVNIVLVEGKNLSAGCKDGTSLPDPYVKFKLAAEKYKSKVAVKTEEPQWLEQFDMHVFDSQQILEVTVIDNKQYLGRCSIDLTSLKPEKTYKNWYTLEDNPGSLLLLLSISGTIGCDTVSDISTESKPFRYDLQRKYALSQSFTQIHDVGTLVINVFRAHDLAAADIGGKSDPFCVLELVNARLQTHVVYGTLNPEWNKVFTFNVKDINSVLEITIFDQDPKKKMDFLGKVAVPLLKINNGEQKWYTLKDEKLDGCAKGRIELEMSVIFNPIKASIRTFKPKETKYVFQEPKFSRQLLMQNVTRVRDFVPWAMELNTFVKSCWSWESPERTIVSFFSFIVATYCFDWYMLPLFLLLTFVIVYIQSVLSGDQKNVDSVAEDDIKTERTMSIKDRINLIQDTLTMVQNSLDYAASLAERVKNTFNFTSPFLSWLAIFVLSIATVVLYCVPIRWIVMLWGINKFTKKFRSSNEIPYNQSVLAFLSRVPSDAEIRLYSELRPEIIDCPPTEND